jgi:phosphoglycolate phosphatase-like HAD superfamily hydrolase
VQGGDASFPRKPDPAALFHLMRAAGAAPGTTLFVGDSMIDVRTARAANVRLAVVLYGFGGLRGDLVLAPGEATAADVPALAAAIEAFLSNSC